MPRIRNIETAIAAYNATDRKTPLLPPEAVRLLGVMFPRDNVCQRSLASLVADGFDRRTAASLVRSLLEAGFLSKEPGQRSGVALIYRLHLPPRRQP